MRGDLSAVCRVLSEKDRFLIACHENPEGDAIGSELALALAPGKITVDQVFSAHAAAKDYSLFTGGPVYQRQISYVFRSEKGAKGALKLSRRIPIFPIT